MVTREAARRLACDSTRYPYRVRRSDGGKITPLREGDTSTVQAAADAFFSPRRLVGGGR
jgi:hypothetical protein